MRHHVSLPSVLDADPLNHLPTKGLWRAVVWSVIFLEGYDAQRDGLPRGINPYQQFGEESCKAWEAGWDQAEVEHPWLDGVAPETHSAA